jgi:hypothetical protein
MSTKDWLTNNQMPYDRLLFDKPYNPVMVTETPPNTKYYKHVGDLNIVADMFEEWKKEIDVNARKEWTDSES